MHERSPTDIEVGVWDADKAFSACIEHTRSLDERQHAYLQCAVLYTTRHGQRRVRTCNLALQITSLAGNVYRFADMDAVVCHLARECECFLSYGIINLIKLHGMAIVSAMMSLSSRRMSQIREELTDQCSSILLGYRRNCAAATTPTQVRTSGMYFLIRFHTCYS